MKPSATAPRIEARPARTSAPPGIQTPTRFRALLLACALAGLSTGSDAESSLPLHSITRVGLHGPDYEDQYGNSASELIGLSDAGTMIGTSAIFRVNSARGQAAWSATPFGETIRVGLYDALHERGDGMSESTPVAINREGVSVGHSTRFSGMERAGQSAWVADRWGTTIKVGFYDPPHTASDGGKFSMALDVNNRNQVIGYSRHPDTRHTTGWIATSTGVIQRIGFFDASHVAPDGTWSSIPVDLNDAGYVIGHSEHHAGTARPDATAWVRTPWATMRQVGFHSGDHESESGQHVSWVRFLSESGFLAGSSRRYRPGSDEDIGQTAWLTHANGPNRPVGFYDAAHRAMNGVVHSEVIAINECGYAIGTSARYAKPDPHEADTFGMTAWIAAPNGATTRVGLYDSGHQLSGFASNTVVALNNTDSLTGQARRFRADGGDLGTDAWVANARGQTTRIGLSDATHTRADGYRLSTADQLTDTGYVAGNTERFLGGPTRVGHTAWIYTRSSRSYVTFELSVRPADGFAESVITHLNEDGSAAGYYVLFGPDGTHLGERGFVYSRERGVVDLSEAFAGALPSLGWEYLGPPTGTNGIGSVAGEAFRTQQPAGAVERSAVYLVQ